MIDWQFIGSLEGTRRVSGYVPNPTRSHSGVTIATGVDLGAMTDELFAKLSPDLQRIVAPYRHLHGEGALYRLQTLPLEISDEQANELDAVERSASVENLRVEYNDDSETKFNDLPDAAQTVIASVAFQYGSLSTRCPKFWEAAITQNWPKMHDELEDFGDDYASRHKQEANHLGSVLNEGQHGE